MTARSDTLDPAGDTAPPTADAAGGARRRSIRVAPVLAVLLVLALGAVAISPAVRHQLAQSFTRQDKGYLELFFVDEQAARDCPVNTVGTQEQAQVAVGVTSHYDSRRSLAWAVTVSPTGGTVRVQWGRLDVRPGVTARFVATVPVVPAAGSTGYTVAVTLPGRAPRLLLHC